MANEKRLIDANDLLLEYCQANGCNEVNDEICPNCFTAGLIASAPTVNAVVLPYHPRPLLKDRNPHNTDVYCPECGTNLSGYYGDEPLPIVTCFNCGEILDPCKATTGTDGERNGNGC